MENGQVYVCNFFVRKSDGAKFAHCTCKAGNPPADKDGVPMYEPRPCKHISVAICLAMYDKTVRDAAMQAAQSPIAA